MDHSPNLELIRSSEVDPFTGRRASSQSEAPVDRSPSAAHSKAHPQSRSAGPDPVDSRKPLSESKTSGTTPEPTEDGASQSEYAFSGDRAELEGKIGRAMLQELVEQAEKLEAPARFIKHWALGTVTVSTGNEASSSSSNPASAFSGETTDREANIGREILQDHQLYVELLWARDKTIEELEGQVETLGAKDNTIKELEEQVKMSEAKDKIIKHLGQSLNKLKEKQSQAMTDLVGHALTWLLMGTLAGVVLDEFYLRKKTLSKDRTLDKTPDMQPTTVRPVSSPQSHHHRRPGSEGKESSWRSWFWKDS